MTIYTKIRLVFLTLLLSLGLAACSMLPLPSDTTGTLIVLRHADREGDQLSAEGIARAEALPAALAGVAIDAIYSPGVQRNLDTAAPLAQKRGLDVIRIPATNVATRMFTGNSGKTLVWVGNKDNITNLWAEIDAPGTPPLTYGDLFIVELRANQPPLVVRRHFGK